MRRDDCSVCRHHRRDDVDAELRDGRQAAQVANRHWLKPADLQRHQAEHLEPAQPAERPAPHPQHGAAFLEAMRRRAAAEGVVVLHTTRRWRERVGWWYCQ